MVIASPEHSPHGAGRASLAMIDRRRADAWRDGRARMSQNARRSVKRGHPSDPLLHCSETRAATPSWRRSLLSEGGVKPPSLSGGSSARWQLGEAAPREVVSLWLIHGLRMRCEGARAPVSGKGGLDRRVVARSIERLPAEGTGDELPQYQPCSSSSAGPKAHEGLCRYPLSPTRLAQRTGSG